MLHENEAESNGPTKAISRRDNNLFSVIIKRILSLTSI